MMLDAMIIAGTVGTPYATCWIVPIGGNVDEVAGASIVKKGIHVRVENKKVNTGLSGLSGEAGIECHESSVVVVMSTKGYLADTVHAVEDVIGPPCHSVKVNIPYQKRGFT